MAGPLIDLDSVRRVYGRGATDVVALDGVSLTIEAGEFVAVMGTSGSGKSTLMNILGCLDRPTDGRYRVRGVEVATLDADDLAALRRDTFGLVFQRYNLLLTATALENVEIPAIYAGARTLERHRRARGLLATLGLGERGHHRPSELSGGQQQRVSIARSLMNGASVILADEPTGALDSASSADLLDLFDGLNAEGRTIVGTPCARGGGRRSAELVDDPADHGSGEAGLSLVAANLFRTSLTLLGVVIGVAAVVAMLALG